ncbi:hypothetical protein L3X38_016429 [Prunus dulcis]|uniref:Uncharacterized protein n=1 Tax=Prunus dulcis TaxID=3755 RepID=A0AAD4W5B3_PRUDU|nr:hypothetical protein L3X38_016429 [Prunus dulcis]
MSRFSRRVPFGCGVCEFCFGLVEHYRARIELQNEICYKKVFESLRQGYQGSGIRSFSKGHNQNSSEIGFNIYNNYPLDIVKHWIPHKELQNARGIDILKKYMLDNVEHWIPHKELQNARGFDLNGPILGGRPPVLGSSIKQASITNYSWMIVVPASEERTT